MAGSSSPDDADDPKLRQRLDGLYATRPPWEIGRPQQAFLHLAEQGAVRGQVLDIGCGTGEHVLMCAGLGLDATGLDLADRALRVAQDKADRRGLTARFIHHDARRLPALGERFDTVLDSGLFHMLDPAERSAFADGLHAVLRPGGRYFMLCFSDREPRTPGVTVPYQLTRDDLMDTFAGRLHVDALEPATIEITLNTTGIRGWLLSGTRSPVAEGARTD